MSKGSRQDYIARIRYQNELPPPPCPPKLLDIDIDISKFTSSAYLSGLIKKQPVDVNIDMDLGMPLDMTQVAGIFERDDESGIFPMIPTPILDAKDRELLQDPSGSKGVSKSQPGVSFLRRTEYISSESIRQKSTTDARSSALKRQQVETTDPDAQLRAVETTFDNANTPLDQLKHPRKRHLTAVEAQPFLPDSKMLDLVYLAVKMVGSAALSAQRDRESDNRLAVSLFRPITLETDEWMSFFLTDEANSLDLKQRLNSPSDTKSEDPTVYRFEHVKDYDMEYVQHGSSLDEVAINFSKEDSTVRYVPVAGRTNLKRRRVVQNQRELAQAHNMAAVELSLREVSGSEMITRDNIRSTYDPISYVETKIDEEDEEDDGHQEHTEEPVE